MAMKNQLKIRNLKLKNYSISHPTFLILHF